MIQRVSYESKNDYAVNCILFYTILSAESQVQRYIEVQPSHLKQFVTLYQVYKNIELPDDTQLIKYSVLSINLIYNICNHFKRLGSKATNFQQIFTFQQQLEVFRETRE